MTVRTRLGRAVAWIRGELDQQADRGRPVPAVVRDTVDLLSALLGGSEPVPGRRMPRSGGEPPREWRAPEPEEATFEPVSERPPSPVDDVGGGAAGAPGTGMDRGGWTSGPAAREPDTDPSSSAPRKTKAAKKASSKDAGDAKKKAKKTSSTKKTSSSKKPAATKAKTTKKAGSRASTKKQPSTKSGSAKKKAKTAKKAGQKGARTKASATSTGTPTATTGGRKKKPPKTKAGASPSDGGSVPASPGKTKKKRPAARRKSG